MKLHESTLGQTRSRGNCWMATKDKVSHRLDCCGVFYARLYCGLEGARDPLDLSTAKLGISCHLAHSKKPLCQLLRQFSCDAHFLKDWTDTV